MESLENCLKNHQSKLNPVGYSGMKSYLAKTDADPVSKKIIGFYDGFFGPGTGSFLLFAFLMVGFDFLGAAANARALNFASNISAAVLFSYFGIVDLTGVPKDRFFLYRSPWNPLAPTAHLLPHWNWEGRAAKADGRLIVPVFVYGSGD